MAMFFFSCSEGSISSTLGTKMGKYGKNISPSSVVSQQNHHFFQVFIPNKSSHHL
ncbi:hypothetical protein MKX01_024808, partial [Papaver californicum]